MLFGKFTVGDQSSSMTLSHVFNLSPVQLSTAVGFTLRLPAFLVTVSIIFRCSPEK